MMFLQTLVQLHILLSAAPALAGWAVCVPVSPVVPVQIVRSIAQHGMTSPSPVSVSHGQGLPRICPRGLSMPGTVNAGHLGALSFPGMPQGAGKLPAAAAPDAPRAP